MIIELQSKVALVSGGGAGIGEAVVRRLVREGARVAIADVNEAAVTALSTRLQAGGADVMSLTLDVTQSSQWQSSVAAVLERFGQLDILVNNAGIYERQGLENISEESWDRMLEVNAKGVFLGCQAVVQAMRDNGSGAIVNISSTAGIRASLSTHYGASKGAVRLMSKSIAVYHAKDGIRCNSVHPGPVATQMGYQALPEAVREERLARVPLGRFAHPDEIASAVCFLASDDASFITGTELVVDGGATVA
ncbi:MAG: NAD(P)-dependent dehydrogenase (short-subunit alcohol dehydrogenase family) [Gammaproteobacteria bacterium]|jgi:NAD(P)-dependent dehydrogenase (short-subunit alcohol dehydrogenase family)